LVFQSTITFNQWRKRIMNKLHKLSLGAAVALMCLPATVMAADQDKQRGQLGQDQQYGERAQMGQQDQIGERGRMGQEQQQELQVGFDRETVMEIQRELSNEGYEVQVDGLWGPNTQNALRSYQQQEEDLEATGWPDNQTLSQLGIDEERAWRARFDFEGQEQQRGIQDQQQQRLGQEHGQTGERGQLGQEHQDQERVGEMNRIN